MPTALASQQIGFALQNVTGGNIAYGANGYHASQGSTHTFYSHLSIAAMNSAAVDPTDLVTTKTCTAYYRSGGCKTYSTTTSNPETYASTTKNCSLQVSAVANVNNLPTPPSGSCYNTMPASAAASCSQLHGQNLVFYYNDMGGNPDDYDYNDAEFAISCQFSGSGSGPTTVVLVQ